MLELLVPNAAKAIMAERHKFLESGSWEKATSIARSNAYSQLGAGPDHLRYMIQYSGGGPARHQASQACPDIQGAWGNQLHKQPHRVIK